VVPREPSPSSRLALVVLTGIAVVAPWPFGAVQPKAVLALTTVGLLTAVVTLALDARGGGAALPAVPLWPLAGFAAVGVAQLVPLPPPLHALLAPGSHAVWHPVEPSAAAVLGGGWAPVSLDPDTTLRAVALVVSLGLLGALAAPALARPRPALGAAATVAAGGFLLSVYAIFARARFGVLLYGRFPVPTVAPFGPFVSKNHFAGYVAMAALLSAGLALGLADSARRSRGDWTASSRAGAVVLALVAAAAMALAVLASLSRGGGIALVAGAAAFAALAVLRSRRGKKRRGLVPSLVLAGALGLVVVALVPPETHERLQSLSGASLRLDTWRDGLRLALSSPLVGTGLGTFHDAYPRFKSGYGSLRVEHAENDYVETLGETGLLGLGFALVVGAVLVAGAGRGIRSDAHGLVRGVGIGALAGLVALGVHSAVDFNLRIPSNAALAALLAAAVAGAAGVRPRPLGRLASALLALLALVLLIAILARPQERWRAAYNETQLVMLAQTPESRALRLGRAEVALDRFLRRRPAHAESWLMLAGVRAARGDLASAAALAAHAVALDPEREALREAARPLQREKGASRP
jgi:O-antigen ligase